MDWLSPFFMSSLCSTFYQLPFLFPRPWPTISLPTLSCPYITSLTEIYIRHSDRGSTLWPTLTTRTKFHVFKKSALWALLLSFYYKGFSFLFRLCFAVFFFPTCSHFPSHPPTIDLRVLLFLLSPWLFTTFFFPPFELASEAALVFQDPLRLTDKYFPLIFQSRI